ncbi:MAG: type II toxin-antitoxin system RelE/ParE family toxin [Bacteroidota bacterium]
MVKHKVLITPEAKQSIKAVYDYYFWRISRQMARNINDGIRNDIRLLAEQPYLGRIESIANIDYYVLVSVNYKIIYTIHKQALQVIILEVFDSRQSPDKLNP